MEIDSARTNELKHVLSFYLSSRFCEHNARRKSKPRQPKLPSKGASVVNGLEDHVS